MNVTEDPSSSSIENTSDCPEHQAATPHPGVSPLSSTYCFFDVEEDGTHPTSPPRGPVSTETPGLNKYSSSSQTAISTSPASPSKTFSLNHPPSLYETPANSAGPGQTCICVSPAETAVLTNPANPPQTVVSPNPTSMPGPIRSPQKQSTAKKGIVVTQPQGKHRKRGRPPKRHPRSSKHEHPCLQPVTHMEAVKVTKPLSPESYAPEDNFQALDAKTEARTELLRHGSPCPGVGCLVPEASEPTSPSRDLQSPCEGRSKNSPNLWSASVRQGDTASPNVLTVGRTTDSPVTEAREAEHELGQTGIILSKRIKVQRTLYQSPQHLIDKKRTRKPCKVSLPQKTDYRHQADIVREGVIMNTNSPRIKTEQKTCQSKETLRKRKYVKRSPISKEDMKSSPNIRQQSESARKEKNTSVKSPTPKVDTSFETRRKRKYSGKCKTPDVDQSQESLTKTNEVSKRSRTHQVNQPQVSSTKRKKVSKTSPNSNVEQTQVSGTKRKKVSKKPGTQMVDKSHETDPSQNAATKRKYAKKSNSQKSPTRQNTTDGSQRNKIDQAASIKSQSHTVDKPLAVDRSQKTVGKRNITNKDHNTSRSQSGRVDQEAAMKDEKRSKTSQKKNVQSQERTVKTGSHIDVFNALPPIPVRSVDFPSSPLNSSGVPKRKYRKKSETHKSVSDIPSDLELSAGLSTDLASSGSPFSPKTPRRRGRPPHVKQQLCSTPDPQPGSFPFSLAEGPNNASPVPPWKPLETSPLRKTVRPDAASPRRQRGGRPRGGDAASLEGGAKRHPGKRRRGPRKGRAAKGSDPHSDQITSADLSRRLRPRLELEEFDSPDGDTGGASLSSDLSIELSLQEDHVTSLTFEVEDDEEQEDEEELPSFLNNKKPLSITEGICVWCKFRNYPFWPAMVKSVNRKLKKASIVFIDNLLFDKKKTRKGFSVALKTLKPFDCEEADELVCKAKEQYDAAIKWCLELIADYRIRIGCGFTGSFIEYFSDDISCPVRRRCPQGTSDLTFPSNLMLEEQHVTSDLEVEEEESHRQERRRKLLPDRSKAARNRANEKLVNYIVRQRRVETRLLGVISGQQQSKWLRCFLAASRTVVDTYLEDEEQLDQVIQYLNGVHKTAPRKAPCLAEVDNIRFVMDVLLPEAVIHAIAGVDKLSLEAAKDKYLKGPCLSKRERDEFDAMIEQQTRCQESQMWPSS